MYTYVRTYIQHAWHLEAPIEHARIGIGIGIWHLALREGLMILFSTAIGWRSCGTGQDR